MNGLLLDTHVWLWKLNDDPALPRRLSHFLDGASATCWLSPISLWEVSMLVRKNRIRVTPDAAGFMRRALDLFPLREASVTFEVAERADKLVSIGDPADTLIAATAMTYDLTLVTVDRRLSRVKGLRTLSR